jgi:hypothetical protein
MKYPRFDFSKSPRDRKVWIFENGLYKIPGKVYFESLK